MSWHLDAAGMPRYEREFRFHPSRRWRFDFAWPEHLLALEVEGGIYTRGRHTRPGGFRADLEKYNAALLLGWRVLRVTGDEIRQGQALRLVEMALADTMAVTGA